MFQENIQQEVVEDGDIGFEKSKDEKRRCRTEEAIRTDDIMKTKPPIRTSTTILGEADLTIFFLLLCFTK